MSTAAAPGQAQASLSQQLGAARIVTPRDDTAVLKLIPLNRQDCQMHLRKQQSSSSTPSPDVIHRPIILKLSHVLDVDTESCLSNTASVIHARRFQDGSVAASVLLGRNETTGIKQSSVSRALCEVSFSRSDSNKITAGKTPDGGQMDSSLVAYLSMRKAPLQHAVHLDGKVVSEPLGRTIPIGDGSIISLWGQFDFCYLVRIQNEDDTTTTTRNSREEEPPSKKRAKSPEESPKKPSEIQVIRKRAHQLMVGESTCALCMEILIKSTFAIPCSHAFCAECTESCNNVCPNCRGPVERWMPARSIDTMIWATALQGCFDPDDARAYLERRKENGDQDPTDEERACIMGEGAADNGSNNGYYMPSPPRNHNVTTMPAIFPQNANGASNLAFLGNNMVVNASRGASADDAICLDSP